MEIIAYPILIRNDPDKSDELIEFRERWGLADSGTFLLAKNDWWHGGAHFKSKTDTGKNHLPRRKEQLISVVGGGGLPGLGSLLPNLPDLGSGSIFSLPKPNTGIGGVCLPPPPPIIYDTSASTEAETFNEAIQAIAKGKIIAYRLNQNWLECEVFQEIKSNREISNLEKYSTSFVLIEHDLEQPYLKLNLGTSTHEEVLFLGYKFYSLYMHLSPVSDLNKPGAMLPWFMCTERKELNPQLNRSEEIILLDPADDSTTTAIDTATRNDLVYVKTIARSVDVTSPVPTTAAPERTIWIPKTSIMRGKGSNNNKYYTVHQIDYYYEPSTKEVDSLHRSIEIDKIKVLPATDAIPVEVGDIIGFPGGTIIDKKHIGGMFHFEIFAKDVNFMENIKASAALSKPYYHNSTEYFYYVTNQGDTTTNPFAAGEFYHQLHHSTSASAGPAWANWYTIGSTENSAGTSYTHTFFNGTTSTVLTSSGATNKFLEIYSDADWKKGPEPWREENASSYVDANGSKTSATLPSSTEKMVFIFHSEWSDDNVPARYAQLKNTMVKYDAFIDFVKGHCFWKEVKAVYTSFPDAGNVFHFHPTSFIGQLRRLMQPYYKATPTKLRRFLDRHTNETLALLKKREDELVQWIGTSSDTDAFPNGAVAQTIKDEFKKWFGYYVPAPVTIPATTTTAGVTTPATTTQPPFVLPTPAGLVVRDSRNNLLSLPSNLTTVRNAIVWVKRMIHNMIRAIEGVISTSKYVNAYASTDGYEDLYGYVYAVDDERMYIHVAHQFLKQPSNINNHNKLYVHDSNPPESGVTIAHELSHFKNIGEMVDATGTNLSKGLYDLVVRYNDAAGISQIIGPYTRTPCEDRALVAPVACLCNADNFAYYVNFDVTQTYDDSFEYYE